MKRFLSPRVLLVALVLAVFSAVVVTAQRTPTAAGAMSTAANAFLASLTPEQRKQATYPFEADERMHWNFIPDETFPRNGLPLKDMTEPQRKLAHALLQSGLSERGYQTYTSIIALENILRVIEGGQRFERDPEALPLLGLRHAGRARAPGAGASKGITSRCTSAWRTGRPSPARRALPASNPAEVRDGAEKGKRVLAPAGGHRARAGDGARRDAAHDGGVQRDGAERDRSTNNTLDINPLSPDGLKVSAMTPAQRDLLMKVIDAYAGLMTADVAADRLAKIKTAGIENVAFAWAGPLERGQKHYYRVQGPTFLIEFDNTQNDGNHVHSIWRDFKGDFGRDLLREHLQASRTELAASPSRRAAGTPPSSRGTRLC